MSKYIVQEFSSVTWPLINKIYKKLKSLKNMLKHINLIHRSQNLSLTKAIQWFLLMNHILHYNIGIQSTQKKSASPIKIVKRYTRWMYMIFVLQWLLCMNNCLCCFNKKALQEMFKTRWVYLSFGLAILLWKSLYSSYCILV